MATMTMPTDMLQGQQQPPAGPQSADPTTSAPATNAGADDTAQGNAPVQVTPEQQDALIEIRKLLKEANVSKRLIFLRRVKRAFEVLKNNPYITFNDTTQEFDTLDTIMQ